MPKVVLYNVDLVFSRELNQTQLNVPEQAKITFNEHIRKKDYLIICSSVSSIAEIQTALKNARIDIDDTEILGKDEMAALDGGQTLEEKKVNRALSVLHNNKLSLNAAVIVDSSNVNITHPYCFHVIVPNINSSFPRSNSYLQVPLLPTSILNERIRPEVENIKSKLDRREIGNIISNSPNNNYLRNLYDSVVKLFKAPASYEKLVVKPIERVEPSYATGISIFSDYCKNQGNSLAILGKLHRFFSGHWNRHHTDAVQEVLNEASLKVKKDKTIETATSLLTELKTKLVEAHNYINPYGSLARRIEFFQKTVGLAVIDIDDLNDEIAAVRRNIARRPVG
jgi:Domain of unknown function (DUF5617)